MQTYDILMLVVLGAATLFGFWKGLAWQIASIASIVVSYFAAHQFSDQLAPRISQHAPWNKFLAMLIIYAATSFVIWMIFRMVSGAIDRVRLKEFDRQMGALVGFGKGILFCIAITFFAVTLLGEEQKQRIVASGSGQTIVKFLDKADSIVPPEIHDIVGPTIQKVEERLDPNYQSPHAGSLETVGRLWESTRQNTQGAGQGGSIWPSSANSTSQNSGPAVGQQTPTNPWQNEPQPLPPRDTRTPAWPASTSTR
ncbi:CvpA family protein [Adhaeretor mobilis]|uniref:Colicin V production protein n=1 Tax=Adhaeretor mobilis TaxID=1930276 RepID=A0A517N093_9BACT|nr:CvpA family protein [Adhaeretor mobilis]QDT00546.1 Colicin V production protein [Adhaeretor mobilis]